MSVDYCPNFRMKLLLWCGVYLVLAETSEERVTSTDASEVESQHLTHQLADGWIFHIHRWRLCVEHLFWRQMFSVCRFQNLYDPIARLVSHNEKQILVVTRVNCEMAMSSFARNNRHDI